MIVQCSLSIIPTTEREILSRGFCLFSALCVWLIHSPMSLDIPHCAVRNLAIYYSSGAPLRSSTQMCPPLFQCFRRPCLNSHVLLSEMRYAHVHCAACDNILFTLESWLRQQAASSFALSFSSLNNTSAVVRLSFARGGMAYDVT